MKSVMTASIVALVCMAGSASAATVTSTFNGVGPVVNMNFSLTDPTATNGGTQAGVFNWTGTAGNPAGLQGGYRAFCIELTQNVSPNTSYTYQTAALEMAPQPATTVTPMGAAKASAIRELFGRFYSPSFGFDINGPGISNEEAAAMQLALWEIVYETASSSGPGPGAAFGLNFGLAGGNAVFSGNASVLGLASGFLAALDGTGPQALDLIALTSDTAQDMLIPTPGAAVLAGLGLVAAGRRRRR